MASFASSSNIIEEDAFSHSIWINSRKARLYSNYCPFTVSFAAGNLRIESFRHFLAQDVPLLKAFTHALEMVGNLAYDDGDKLIISDLRTVMLGELKMHSSFAQEWGLDISEEEPAHSATLRYTEYLLATASGNVEGLKAPGIFDTPFQRSKIAAYTLAVVTPYMRLIAYLGKEFRAHLVLSKGNHPYQEWINKYSSEAFQATAKLTEDLLDKLSICMTGDEQDIIEKLYQQAMHLVVKFLHAQPVEQPTIVPLFKEHNRDTDHLMIFSDFDQTCTVVDSSAMLAELAIVTAPKTEQSQSELPSHRMLSADLKNTWDLLSKQYTDGFEECIDNILAKEKVESFDYKGLCEALTELSEFEKMANRRVIESGVLKGLRFKDIQQAGEGLTLQEGCTSFFRKMQRLDTNIHVLSYCWCGDLIWSSFSSRGLKSVKVHTNSFKYEELTYEELTATGEITRKMESPSDKVQEFKKIRETTMEDNKKRITTVYIGDSIGDLLCLLEADVGIVYDSSLSLARVAEHFGISLIPLLTGTIQKQMEEEEGETTKWNGLSGTLYTVSSWDEIYAFILGWM